MPFPEPGPPFKKYLLRIVQAQGTGVLNAISKNCTVTPIQSINIKCFSTEISIANSYHTFHADFRYIVSFSQAHQVFEIKKTTNFMKTK